MFLLLIFFKCIQVKDFKFRSGYATNKNTFGYKYFWLLLLLLVILFLIRNLETLFFGTCVLVLYMLKLENMLVSILIHLQICVLINYVDISSLSLYYSQIYSISFGRCNIEVIVWYFINNHAAKITYNRPYKNISFQQGDFQYYYPHKMTLFLVSK